MERPRIQLGPFDVFSSIMGGVPLLTAAALLYRVHDTPQEIFAMVIGSVSFVAIAALLVASYFLGMVAAVGTWSFFNIESRLLSRDYRYARDDELADAGAGADATDMISDRLDPLVRTRLGKPDSNNALDARLTAYLMHHQKRDVLAQADLFQAQRVNVFDQ